MDSTVLFYLPFSKLLISCDNFQTKKGGFPDSRAVLIPGVQAARPSHHKRANNAERAMINERRSPLPAIHLQELLSELWRPAEAAQSNSAKRVSYLANLCFNRTLC